MFSGPPTDKNSLWKAPPRVLLGEGAWPVYGHTFLFQRLAGDVAFLFSNEWRECRWFGRALGGMFAIYVWGQWRVAIKGPDRSRRLMEEGALTASFPWTPPTTLLGMSCLPFLQDADADQLRIILSRPLGHSSIIKHAHAFSRVAERCLEDISHGLRTRQSKRECDLAGIKNARRSHVKTRQNAEEHSQQMNSSSRCTSDINISDNLPESCREDDDDDGQTNASSQNELKIKWEALRSYSLELVDGPVLNLNLWKSRIRSLQSRGVRTQESSRTNGAERKFRKLPTRATLLLWMDRLKAGVDVIKTTFGPEWMGIWLLNEYGRAINARMHICDIFAKHAKDVSLTVPVEHREGHSYYDPTTQLVPLLTLRDNRKREKEDIFGLQSSADSKHVVAKINGVRARANSAPEVNLSAARSEEYLSRDTAMEYVVPYATEQDLARPRYERSPALNKAKSRPEHHDLSPTRRSFHLNAPAENNYGPSTLTQSAPNERISILEHILRQQDLDGHGVSQAVATELMVILWMALDVGNAWTAMALSLLSFDREACSLVQHEIDELERAYSYEKLFAPSVLCQMKFVDALIYEAIRLCPPFLGGLKMTNKTVEFAEDHLHISKGSCVFFCQPTDVDFNIRGSLGKRPEELGKQYPSVELYGFLPLNGLEVPLMVLQTKVYLVTVLRKYTPLPSKRRTLLHRVSSAVRQSINGSKAKMQLDVTREFVRPQREPTPSLRSSFSDLERGQGTSSLRVTPSDAMAMFTKIPFPEPIRATYLQERSGR